jgi:ABC-type antimicrobial peptide transport system permease subunit
VVFQFALSVILIVSVLVVYRQNQYVQSKNLGYAKDNLISFIMDGTLTERRDAFLEEAGKLPGISHISSIAHDLIGMQNNTSGLDWDGKNPEERILFEHVRVNYDLLETIGVSMKEGRTFSKQFRTDSSAIILNEASVRVMGLQNPVGKYIRMWDEFDLQIIGVVKDFHFQSLHEEINPLFFRLVPDQTHIVIARVENGREQEAIKNLESFYKNFNPGFTFDYRFLDEQYALQYAAEQRVATLSRYFAGFAVFISCLGLFGLAIHTSERRKKEIGIRKIIGASVMQINALLTKEFTRLVLISILIGLPVSYIIMREWLARFVYRIDLSPWYFLIAGLTVLIISWLTVSSQAYLSANLNPKDCLRNE